MGRPKKQEQLKHSIQQNLTNMLKTQEQTRELIEKTIDKISTHLGDENLSMPDQLSILEELSKCVALLGRTNDSTVRTIKALEEPGGGSTGSESSEYDDLEPAAILQQLGNKRS